jgi:hypothetical protein
MKLVFIKYHVRHCINQARRHISLKCKSSFVSWFRRLLPVIRTNPTTSVVTYMTLIHRQCIYSICASVIHMILSVYSAHTVVDYHHIYSRTVFQ